MTSLKQSYGYVLKSIPKDYSLRPITSHLNDKTFIISGATRGIGFNIATKLAIQGANIVITGKTTQPHSKLEVTIYSSKKDIVNKGVSAHRCLAIPCDIRNYEDIQNVINKTINTFGSIDGAVLNASALCLNNTKNQTKKEVDLMTDVNIKGTYFVGQEVLKHMTKGHITVLSPPLDMLCHDHWWVNHLYYSMSKFNMSLMAHYWNKEYPSVAVNTLWPRTTIDTAPVRNLLGGKEMVNISRTPDIVGDAAMHMFKTDPLICNGKHYIDDEVLTSLDIDVEQYRVNPSIQEKELMPDFFC